MGSRPSVCLSVCCVNTGDQEQLQGDTETIKPVGQTNSWLELAGTALRVRPEGEGEGGETTHRPHRFFTHIHLPVVSEAQLAKKTVHKMD